MKRIRFTPRRGAGRGACRGAACCALFCALFCALCCFLLSAGLSAADAPVFPKSISGYRAEGKVETYDRETVYDYMDGGAEIYLQCGMKSLRVQKYVKKGQPPVAFDLFEMDSPEGAFGAFTFEREDEGVQIGQGSEYGGGLLRFWQGRFFAFVQAERETPASREAVLALGRAVVGSLGPAGTEPKLQRSLQAGDLRPLSARYIRSPLLLEVLEPQFADNPLALAPHCEAVLGRYGPKGNTERVLVVGYADPTAAEAGSTNLLRAWTKDSAAMKEPFLRGGSWTAVGRSGPLVFLVLGAADRGAAIARLEIVTRNLEGVTP